MSKKQKSKSKCCKASVRSSGFVPDFIGDDPKTMRIGTTHTVCNKCGEACDVVEAKKKNLTPATLRKAARILERKAKPPPGAWEEKIKPGGRLKRITEKDNLYDYALLAMKCAFETRGRIASLSPENVNTESLVLYAELTELSCLFHDLGQEAERREKKGGKQ